MNTFLVQHRITITNPELCVRLRTFMQVRTPDDMPRLFASVGACA